MPKIAGQVATDRIQLRVRRRLLPQTCEIIVPGYEVDASGISTPIAERRFTYRGTSAIPCRLDASKHYRQASVLNQEVIVSEYDMYLPRSVVPTLNCTIIVGDSTFEVRKVLEAQAWDTTTQVLLVRVNGGYGLDVPDARLALDSDNDFFLLDGGGFLELE